MRFKRAAVHQAGIGGGGLSEDLGKGEEEEMTNLRNSQTVKLSRCGKR